MLRSIPLKNLKGTPKNILSFNLHQRSVGKTCVIDLTEHLVHQIND